MIKNGFIKEVCEPRTFTDKEGKAGSGNASSWATSSKIWRAEP